MLKPNNELGYAMSDLYPNFGGYDTSTLATPEEDDLEALNEDTKIAEESKSTGAKSKNIFVALFIFISLIIFFGGGE